MHNQRTYRIDRSERTEYVKYERKTDRTFAMAAPGQKERVELYAAIIAEGHRIFEEGEYKPLDVSDNLG